MTSQPGDTSVGPVIVRTLSGGATPADEAELRRWLAAAPDRERELTALRTIWNEAETLQRDWDTTALQQRILRPDGTRVTPFPGAARAARGGHPKASLTLLGRRSRPWLAVAAAVVVAAAGVLMWRLTDARRPFVGAGSAAFTEVATRRGQRATLQLSDGSRITLSVDSRLRYPEAFTRGAGREVYLEGEAYFEVAHDVTRPFRVHVGDATVRVLGTRFGVRAYAEDHGVRVVVAEGRVGLGRGDTTAVLRGGDLGTLEPGRVPVVRNRVDVQDYLAWVEGRLVFADTPLGEVVQDLSRWYDLDVRLGDPSLAKTPFTFTIPLRGDEPADKVLQTIARSVGGRLERRGTAYVLLSSVARVS